MNGQVSAASVGLISCHDCGLVSRDRKGPPGTLAHCPRCGDVLHARKPNSMTASTALLIAAMILYIPANVLPVSTIVWLGHGEPDTIMSGVKVLFASGDVPVALLLFFASITVPMLKMLALAWLLLSVKFRWMWRPKDRTKVYRLVEIIGRWSMLDIFVISILVALVQIESLASITAGPGAISFCAVVVLTIFAAEKFDPRLIWDAMEEEA